LSFWLPSVLLIQQDSSSTSMEDIHILTGR